MNENSEAELENNQMTWSTRSKVTENDAVARKLTGRSYTTSILSNKERTNDK